MEKTNEQMLHEILQRTVRLETRVVQLGDHVGANLRDRQRIDIEPTRESVVVYVDAMDVSLSRIITEVTQSDSWKLAKPGIHMVQIRMGSRREHTVVGEVVVPR